MLSMEGKLNHLGVRTGAGCAGYCMAAEVMDCLGLGAHLDGCGGVEVGWLTLVVDNVASIETAKGALYARL